MLPLLGNETYFSTTRAISPRQHHRRQLRCQSSFTLGKSMLTVPRYLFVLLVLRNMLLEDLFQDSLRVKSEAELLVFPWIFDIRTFVFSKFRDAAHFSMTLQKR